jgi:hypothetical protein
MTDYGPGRQGSKAVILSMFHMFMSKSWTWQKWKIKDQKKVRQKMQSVFTQRLIDNINLSDTVAKKMKNLKTEQQNENKMKQRGRPKSWPIR